MQRPGHRLVVQMSQRGERRVGPARRHFAFRPVYVDVIAMTASHTAISTLWPGRQLQRVRQATGEILPERSGRTT